MAGAPQITPDPKLQFHFRRFRGDVKPLAVTILQNGQPVDISGWTFEFDVGHDGQPLLAQVAWTVGPGATNGKTAAVVTTVASKLPAGVYPYQLRYRTTDNPPQIVTFAYGNFTVVPSNNQT